MALGLSPKSLWQEFKNFAFKGNMIDLAVAFVLGAAFGKVVESLVKNVFMPLISYVTPNVKYDDWYLGKIAIGSFIAEIINFLVVALAIFVFVVKLIGTLTRLRAREEAPAAPTTKECPLCLSAIPIKAKRCAHCASDLPEAPAGA